MLKRIGAESTSELKAVASGTLPSGRPVIVNADGTVSLPVSTPTSAGTEVVFESASTSNIDVGFDSSNNKIVVVYRDGGDSDNGKAVVGTVDPSDNSITFGTPVTFNSGRADNPRIAFDTTNNKIVIIYSDHPSSLRGKAIVGTVSGTSISFGSEVQYESGRTDWNSVAFDSTNGKIVAVYQDMDDSDKGKAVVGTVSGTSISFGTPVQIHTNNFQYSAATFDSTNGKVVIAFRDNDTTSGRAIVGTVSGTSISFGSAVTYSTDNVRDQDMAFDTVNGKVVIAFRDEGNSDVGTAIVGTVSGTSISFGSKVVYFSTRADDNDISYNTAAGKFMITFIDDSGTPLKAIGVTVSGTSLEVDGSAATIAAAASTLPMNVYDSNADRIVVAWGDSGNSTYGTAAVVTTGFDTLTSENYIGMSRGVVTGEPAATGTAVSFESGTTTLARAAFDSSNNKVVIVYQDAGDSDKGKVVVGTVSGTSISFGSVVTFNTGGTSDIDCAFDSSNNKIVIVYSDVGNSGHGTAIVGTVSGTSISFGSEVVFESASSDNISIGFDSSNNKVVIGYRDEGNSDYGAAIVGTVSGTSISFGTAVVFESAGTVQTSTIFDSSSNKVVIAYQDAADNNRGTAIVGTVSGTSISFGSAVQFETGIADEIEAVFDSTNNKVVISYKLLHSNHGKSIVGTVSGTSISFGSSVTFNAASTHGISTVFDSTNNKVVVAYEDRGDSDKGKFVVGTVSGTSISFGTASGFSGSNAVFQTGATFDSNANKVVIAYANDTDGGDRGEAIVTNIDSLNRGEVASGGHVLVDTQGAISDNQLGLTAGQSYFVQSDGTIGTTADSPSVFAGTAVSATKLIVKG